jgi:hypothetical protein
MRVLIPSDNCDSVAELVHGYRNLGCDVVTGAFNFELEAARFDLIHYQWPEEFCAWNPPTDDRLREITAKLARWQDQCPSLITAHNYYLQGYEGNDQLKKLSCEFYARCSLIQHFSVASKNLICNEYAGARHDRHLVTTPWNYDVALGKQQKRGDCREQFGFAANDFVVLVFGALRSWQEIDLVTRAFSSCGAPNKQLLMTGRYNEGGGKWQQRWRRMRWGFWLWFNGAVVEERFIPDDQLYRYWDSADVVIVPRLRELNSGIPSIALTFGKLIIVPKQGSFPEHLAGTDNLFYESGDAPSLARAIEKAASLDRRKIEADNRRLADTWNGSDVLRQCLDVIEKQPAAKCTVR